MVGSGCFIFRAGSGGGPNVLTFCPTADENTAEAAAKRQGLRREALYQLGGVSMASLCPSRRRPVVA